MKNLVTFFAKNSEGVQLVGIGLTDEVIEHLKKTGGIIQESGRNSQAVDVTLLYGPTLNELMKTIDRIVPKDKREMRFL